MDRYEHDAYIDEIMTKYWAETRNYALSLTKGDVAAAEDLVQIAIIQTHYHLLEHPNEPIMNPSGWLRTLVRNRFLNAQRCKLDKATISLDKMMVAHTTAENGTFAIEFQGPSEDEPENVVEANEEEKEENDSKKKAIIALTLDEICKRVAIDRFVEDLSVQEIAYNLGMTQAQVKKHINLFLKELKRIQMEHIVRLEGIHE